jgi:DNA replication and repair protein RecF
LEESAGERPIAVLDDVMSELDSMRQDYLLNHMNSWQVFISCCDPHTVRGLDKGRIINVEAGKFSSVNNKTQRINSHE